MVPFDAAAAPLSISDMLAEDLGLAFASAATSGTRTRTRRQPRMRSHRVTRASLCAGAVNAAGVLGALSLRTGVPDHAIPLPMANAQARACTRSHAHSIRGG